MDSRVRGSFSGGSSGDKQSSDLAWSPEAFVRIAGALGDDVDMLICLKIVMSLTSLSRSSVYAFTDPDNPAFDKTFPPRVAIRGRVAWSFRGVQEWIRARISEASASVRS